MKFILIMRVLIIFLFISLSCGSGKFYQSCNENEEFKLVFYDKIEVIDSFIKGVGE